MKNKRATAVTTLGVLALVSSLNSASADPREDVLDAMGKCAAITADQQRLACYDAMAPRVRDALNVPPAALSAPPTKEQQQSWFGFNLANIFGTAPAQQTTPEVFGAEKIPPKPVAPAATETTVASSAPPPPEPEELQSISSVVTDYSFTPDGKFIVFLQNGQVWRELQGETTQPHFHKLASENSVVIERGMIGSYNMLINDSAKTYKVSRLK